MSGAQVDFVIVGGGSAGSALANRLSADPGTSVLVLEAGRSDFMCGPVHPHAGRAAVPDREPALRLEVRVRARALHARPADLPRPGQGARRLEQHQRDDLPARQPAGLRAMGRRPGDGDLGLRPLPALLQAHGDLPGRRRRLARRQRAAGARARPGDQPAVRRLLRGRPAGRLPADRRRQRLPPGGLRQVRPQHPPRPAAQCRPGLPAPGDEPAEPHRAHPRADHPDRLRGQPRGRRRVHRRRAGSAPSAPARSSSAAARSTRRSCCSSPVSATPPTSSGSGSTSSPTCPGSASTCRTTSRSTSSTPASCRCRSRRA